jgi:hypothetical protein
MGWCLVKAQGELLHFLPYVLHFNSCLLVKLSQREVQLNVSLKRGDVSRKASAVGSYEHGNETLALK